MKILYVTTIGGTMSFFVSLIKELLDMGYSVDIATNERNSQVPICYREWGCTIYQIETSRVPIDKGNLKAFKQLKELAEKNEYDIVHCHTPIAAMCTRLACRKIRKTGTTVFYTAHGFHFYKGAPLKNWLLYYPVEKICSYMTDVLITINQEDYVLAKKKMKAKLVEYVPGVGIDIEKIKETPGLKREEIRKKINCKTDELLLLSVGELNRNKNHSVVIKALSKLQNPKVKYMIAGKGELEYELKCLIETLGLKNQVFLLGFRNDVLEIYKAADVFVFPSYREGLSVSLMEAMANQLLCVVSKVRGNSDLITNKEYLFAPQDDEQLASVLKKIVRHFPIHEGKKNSRRIQRFSTELVNREMLTLYEKFI